MSVQIVTANKKPKLTIGMATYDDYEGCYWTLQMLREYHDMSDVELLVIDNHPAYPSSTTLKNQIESFFRWGCYNTRYVAAPEVVGTSAPRNLVFELGEGEIVMCIDSHVGIGRGGVDALKGFYARNPDFMGLIQGPMLTDSLLRAPSHLHTVFMDIWRGGMWGVWSEVWKTPNGNMFGVFDPSDDATGPAEYYEMKMNPAILKGEYGGMILPETGYSGHQDHLFQAGAVPVGCKPNEIYDIPGQGLGMFACRKDAWLGFNPGFRGFGGEEIYIHEKFRQAGRRCIGFSDIPWFHRFHKPYGAKYPLSDWNKIRNYALGHRELSIPYDRLREHFLVSSGNPRGIKVMPDHEWDYLMEHMDDPVTPKFQAPLPPDITIDTIYDNVKAIKIDKGNYFAEHMDKIRELSSASESAVEVSRFHETTVAMIAGQPKKLHSFIFGANRGLGIYAQLQQLNKSTEWKMEQSEDFELYNIPECDLLLYKTKHCEKELYKNLDHFSKNVKRWIILHDTSRNGEHLDADENGLSGPGYAPAMRSFCEDHKQWFVIHHNIASCGLTILSCNPLDRPAEPIHAWNPGKGPGTELTKILNSVGINPTDKCDCRARANQMDWWGIKGCKENIDEIIKWMREGYKGWGWADKLKAATKSVVSGLVFTFNPLDPFPGLVAESIHRAEIQEEEDRKSCQN